MNHQEYVVYCNTNTIFWVGLIHLYKYVDNLYNECVVFRNHVLVCLDLFQRFCQSESQNVFQVVTYVGGNNSS